MPTILTIDGMRVVIYPADHRPAHVHVIGPNFELVFILNCPDGPLELREIRGKSPSLSKINQICDVLTAQIAALCAAWREYHGDH